MIYTCSSGQKCPSAEDCSVRGKYRRPLLAFQQLYCGLLMFSLCELPHDFVHILDVRISRITYACALAQTEWKSLSLSLSLSLSPSLPLSLSPPLPLPLSLSLSRRRPPQLCSMPESHTRKLVSMQCEPNETSGESPGGLLPSLPSAMALMWLPSYEPDLHSGNSACTFRHISSEVVERS